MKSRWGNCGFSSSAQAKDPLKSRKDLSANKHEIAVNDRNIAILIHRDYVRL